MGGHDLRDDAKKVARFGLLAALSLVLGWVDRDIPLTALLDGAVPGIKLGLANTVLLYAVYLMDWRGCVLLMLTKVFLSGFLFGSMSAILYSLSGGVLSLAVMLLMRRNARRGALAIALLCAAGAVALLARPGKAPWIYVLLAVLACAAALAVYRLIQRDASLGAVAVSLAGAVAHNVGQVLAAAWVLRTPRLLSTYLPVLVIVGAAVGCLTGLVARRVFKALKAPYSP